MMQLLVTKQEGRIISAWSEEGRICQIQAEEEGQAGLLGNIYVGKVCNIVKNINAAFVEFQKGQMGYLALQPFSCPICTDSVVHSKGHILVGDEILVQVKKEAVKTKPPTLSGVLEFSGKYVVLLAGSRQISVSHKIKDKQVRSHLREFLGKHSEAGEFGLLARTNCAQASKEEILGEIQDLKEKYQKLVGYGRHKTKFSCLYQAPAAWLLSMRDLYQDKSCSVITDSVEIYQTAEAYLKGNGWENQVSLSMWDNGHGKMDAVFDISKSLKKALQAKVWLKNGAYIIIQPTEALVSVDVNTGKAVSKKKDVQKTFLKVNLEAAKEIAFQLRLRNLSGMILVDFIDMVSDEDNKTLLEVFREALAKDPVPANVVDMTKLGLVEVTRKKVRKPLYEQVNLKQQAIGFD